MIIMIITMAGACATTSLLLFRRFDGDGHPRRVFRQRADKPFMFCCGLWCIFLQKTESRPPQRPTGMPCAMGGETPQITRPVRHRQRLQPPEQPVRRDERPPHAEEGRIAENLQQSVQFLRIHGFGYCPLAKTSCLSIIKHKF